MDCNEIGCETVLKLPKPFNKELLGIVLPAAGERLMMRAGDVVIVAIIVTFGTAVVGGNAIGENLIQFNYMPGIGGGYSHGYLGC